jgi:hypothetical protein
MVDRLHLRTALLTVHLRALRSAGRGISSCFRVKRPLIVKCVLFLLFRLPG